ncbi:fructosamine kinase family protein [Actinokineospora fastidiosa]|uniref:Fructosamine kinase n=1 Tax=Actinokineospora fastidiosa TaxID=1816 RepID=A0A918G1P1_9PSEU|nr:fructosamine kinase family protein [Actinokineospora fastidiosa]GGS12619.1 fructosamine kinase [Actinokineospora fastidiosa]
MTPAEAVAELLQTPVAGVVAVAADVFEVDLADGDLVVAKRHHRLGQAAAEVGGLAWLAEAAVPAPGVRAADETWVVMDQVEPGHPSVDAAVGLGRDLARLHAAGADAFGDGPTADAWIGQAPMANVPGRDWPGWYAEHRLLPYLRAAVDAGSLRDPGPVEAVCERIGELAGPPEAPARLHGDLWSGNVLWAADGRAWLIDPAAHGGHRETDLAMLALFGCPHLDTVIAAYEEVSPLAPGWRARVPLHQLFPLLVHTVLFGAGYARQTVSAARAALSG